MNLALMSSTIKTIHLPELKDYQIHHFKRIQDLFVNPAHHDWLIIDNHFREGVFGAVEIAELYEKQHYQGNVWIFNSHRNIHRDGILRTDFVYERKLLNLEELAYHLRFEQSQKDQFINARRLKNKDMTIESLS
jgi:hypothetical protein